MTLLSPEVEATYELLQELGQGGMGAVYKVRHRVFGDVCVIKVMQTNLQDNPALRDRFESEAKRGRQLEHPNIARVLNFFIGSNGNAHLVMEFVDGVNLAELQKRNGTPFDCDRGARIAIQALSALGYLHERNIVHRDISPDNLMQTTGADGSTIVKLIDLGIAKSLESTTPLTEIGTFLGKAPYASPEQFGDTIDARSDLYSFGIVLYEMLTAAKPIVGTSFTSYAMAHQRAQPRPFSETDPNGRIPDALRKVILKALEKDPDRRHQSAMAFSAALRDAVPMPPPIDPLARTVPSAPASVVSSAPAEPPKTRRRFEVAAMTTLVALVLAISIIIANRGQRPRIPEPIKETGAPTSSTDMTVTAPATLTPELKTRLGTIVREEIDARRPPEKAIATFASDNGIPPEEVARFASGVTDAANEISRGKKLVAGGDARRAYEAFQRATELDPDNAYAWTNLGAAAVLRKESGEAQRAYERALAIDRKNWLVHYNVGCYYARTGRTDDALHEIQEAVSLLRTKSSASEVTSVIKSIRADDALKELRNDPSFEAILRAE